MDPISQGSLGASMAQAGNWDLSKIKSATLLGCFAGLAPDLDVLIFSPSDPLLFLEYHRQFTHSLVFIPVGALLVAAVMHRFFLLKEAAGALLKEAAGSSLKEAAGASREAADSLLKEAAGAGKGLTFRQSYLYCLLGYATHGLLDTCTTYGTQLFWPFSTERFAWNSISIIDPLFTLPLLALAITGVLRRNPWFARAAIIWALCYIALGTVQRDRAVTAGYELAASRNHQPIRLEAKPGFANLLLWKLVYETDDRFYVDAVRIGLTSKLYPGDSAEKLQVARHFPWLAPDSQQAKDIERFRWFSNNYLALDSQVPGRVIDVRYSMIPNEIEALWAIDVIQGKGQNEHIVWQTPPRNLNEKTQRWWAMLTD